MESCHGCVTGVEMKMLVFQKMVLYGVVNLRLADSEFLIIFGMKRRWRGRDVFECAEVLLMAMCVCFFGAWKVPETSSGLGQRGGGNSSDGLEQTL